MKITSTSGCVDSLIKPMSIIPHIVVTSATNYTQDFESGRQGWFADPTTNERYFDRTSIQPNADDIIFSSDTIDNSWMMTDTVAWTDLNEQPNFAWSSTKQSGNYGSDENSWVNSPSFDITGLDRPMVRFDAKWNFATRADGVVLQYSIDDGKSWNVLGDFNGDNDDASGTNWFNEIGVLTDIGEQSLHVDNAEVLGWSIPSSASLDSGWVNSRHKLDDIPIEGRDSVRFRFALSSNGDAEAEGFAFDNFWIGERTNLVVLEQFSSTLSPTSFASTRDTQNRLRVLENNNGDVIVLDYYTDLIGNNDSINVINSKDPSARTLFYGVESVPSTALSGVVNTVSSGQRTLENLTWSQGDLNRVALKDPGFDVGITLNDQNSSGEILPNYVLDISVDFTSILDLGLDEDTELRGYIALVEDEVLAFNSSTQQMDTLYNVLRKMLPSGAGVRFDAVPLVGNTISMRESWEIDNFNDPLNMSIIAFIQNARDKTIYQSAILTSTEIRDNLELAPTAVVDRERFSTNLFNIYPIPSDNMTYVKFSRRMDNDYEWRVINAAGLVVKTGIVKKGVQNWGINTEFAPSGMYMLQLSNASGMVGSKRFVILH